MKIVQWHNGDLQGVYKQCVDQLRSNLPDEYEYEMITDISQYNEIDWNAGIRSATDALRIHLLHDDPDLIWADTDIMIYPGAPIAFPMESGMIYAYQNTNFLDSPVIYGNRRRDVFKKILDKYYSGISHKCGWLQSLIDNEFREYFRPIPPGNFIHLNLGIVSSRRSGWRSITSENVKIVNLETGPKIVFVKGIIG